MEKILVLIDQEERTGTALEKAARWARRSGARLELFSCCFNHALITSYPFDTKAREHAKRGFIHGCERRLEALAEPLLAEGLQVATDVAWERSREQGILRKLERYDPDLVVKNCGVHRLLGMHLFGHLDWQLIRDCPVPLLLTKSANWHDTPTLVAAVDPMHSHDKPSDLDRQILQTAQRLAGDLGGALKVFHSFQPIPESVIFDDTVVLDFDKFRQQQRFKHLQALKALTDKERIDKSQVLLKEGEAYQALPEFVEEVDADLVVMGAVSRSSLDRLFLGSTAEKVLDYLHCDLLIVKEQGFRGPPVSP